MPKIKKLFLLLVLQIIHTGSVPSTNLALLRSLDTSIKIVLGTTSMLVRTVPAGAEVQLICHLPHPIWYKNNHLLDVSNPLLLHSVREIDAGLYSCFTTEALHGLKWSNLTLNVNTEYSLTQSSLSDIADLQKIEDESEFDLHTDQLIGPSAAEAAVLASDEHKAFNYKTHDVTVAVNAPKFKQQLPTQLSRTMGLPVQLNCFAVGSPTPNITWYLNDTELNDSNERFSNKRWVLFIERLKQKDSGGYKCRVCNVFGCTEQQTQLTVNRRLDPTPYISEHTPQNQTVAIGENARFECQVQSSLEPFISWLKHTDNSYKSVEELEAAVGKEVRKFTTHAHELYLGHVQPEDTGWYTCIAATTVGKAMRSAYLDVVTRETTTPVAATTSALADSSIATPKPNITSPDTEHEESSDHIVEFIEGEAGSAPVFNKRHKMVNLVYKPAGSSITLSCNAAGQPQPNITWTRNNTEIKRHVGSVSYKKWSMDIDEAIAEDSGLYKCTVCNSFGCRSHTTKVVIADRLRSRPIPSDKFPQNQTVEVHGNATFECKVVSDLEPFFTWTRNNFSATLLNKPDMKNVSTTEDIVMKTDPDKPHILRLENVTYADAGWYTCTASNSLGSSTASAYLKVVDKLRSRDVLRSHPMWMAVAAVVVVLLFLLGSIFIIYILRKLKHEKLLKHRIETVHQWTKRVIIYKPPSSECSASELQLPVIRIEKQRTTFEATGNMDPAQAFNEYEFPLDSNWEIPRNQLSLGATLGEGAFGRVVMAEVCGLPRMATVNNSSSIVAVKMVKEEHTDADMASLVREMEVMKIIGKHINIINLIGCCSQNGPLWVIVEFAPHGNLKDFLKKNRPLSVNSPIFARNSKLLMEDKPQLSEKNLISFSYQIARGMEYLASRRKLPDKILVKQKHLIESFNTTRPSLSAADVARYQKTYARFTNKEKGSREFVAKRATLA